jgi:hypothetical protein
MSAEGIENTTMDKTGDQAEPNEVEGELLRRVARFGAYTAPALLALLTGEAHAQGDSSK